MISDPTKVKCLDIIQQEIKELYKKDIPENVLFKIASTQFDVYTEGARRGMMVNIPKIGVFMPSTSDRLKAIKKELKKVTEGVKKENYSLHAKKLVVQKEEEIKFISKVLGKPNTTLKELINTAPKDKNGKSVFSKFLDDERQQ